MKDFMKIYDVCYKNFQACVKINKADSVIMFGWNKKCIHKTTFLVLNKVSNDILKISNLCNKLLFLNDSLN